MSSKFNFIFYSTFIYINILYNYQLIIFKYKKLNYGEIQWAAVNTHWLLIKDPPHMCLLSVTYTCHGWLFLLASPPPTIFIPSGDKRTFGDPQPLALF